MNLNPNITLSISLRRLPFLQLYAREFTTALITFRDSTINCLKSSSAARCVSMFWKKRIFFAFDVERG